MIFDNSSENKTALSWVKSEFPTRKQGKIAIGYFYLSGFRLVKEDIPLNETEKPVLKIIMGRETDLETKQELIEGYSLREDFHSRMLSDLNPSTLDEEQRQNLRNLKELIASELVEVRLFESARLHAKLYLLLDKNPSMHSSKGIALLGSSNFTQAGLTQNKELNVSITDKANIDYLDEWFETLWNESSEFNKDLLQAISIAGITTPNEADKKEYPALGESVSPEKLFRYLVFRWFDGRVSQLSKSDILAEFQIVGVLNAVKMMNFYNGAIIADSVGLGKSFLAMAIVEEFLEGKYPKWISSSEKTPSVLFLLPPAVISQWKEILFGDGEIPAQGKTVILAGTYFFNGRKAKVIQEKDNDFIVELTNENNQTKSRIHFYSYGLFQTLPDENYVRKNLSDVYDLIIVDEAHKYRNRSSRRWRLLRALQKKTDGKTWNKMLLLTATPINNSILDVFNLISLFSDDTFFTFRYKGVKIVSLFHEYTKLFGEFQKSGDKDIEKKLKDSSKKIREKVLDEVILLRTRKYIRDNFEQAEISGKKLSFQDPKPVAIDSASFFPENLKQFYGTIAEKLGLIRFEHTLLYGAQYVTFSNVGLSEDGKTKENRIPVLMGDIFRLLLGKRLESSLFAFETTLLKILYKEKSLLEQFQISYKSILNKESLRVFILDCLEKSNLKDDKELELLREEVDIDSGESDWFEFVYETITNQYVEHFCIKNQKPIDVNFTESEKIRMGLETIQVFLADDVRMISELTKWLDSYKKKNTIGQLIEIGKVPKNQNSNSTDIHVYEVDPKLEILKQVLGKIENRSELVQSYPALWGKKVIVFTQYKDTAYYLYHHLEKWIKENPDIAASLINKREKPKLGLVTGDTDSITRAHIKQRFAPMANKGEEVVKSFGEIDILIATDAFSEGVNLQDAHAVVNFDLPWNPMTIVQRVGRINRIGNEKEIDVLNYFPSQELQALVSVLKKLQEKIKDIRYLVGVDTKILDPDQAIEIHTLGEKFKKLSEMSMEDLELDGLHSDLVGTPSIRNRFQMEEFELLNRIQFKYKYTKEDFQEFSMDSPQKYYSFIKGNSEENKVYSVFEMLRGGDGDEKSIEKYIKSASLSNPNELTNESPLSLCKLVEENYKKRYPSKVFEIAEALRTMNARMEFEKEEKNQELAPDQIGFLRDLGKFLYAASKNREWKTKPELLAVFQNVYNQLNAVQAAKYSREMKAMLREKNLLEERGSFLSLTKNKEEEALKQIAEFFQTKNLSEINLSSTLRQYGWYYIG